MAASVLSCFNNNGSILIAMSWRGGRPVLGRPTLRALVMGSNLLLTICQPQPKTKNTCGLVVLSRCLPGPPLSDDEFYKRVPIGALVYSHYVGIVNFELLRCRSRGSLQARLKRDQGRSRAKRIASSISCILSADRTAIRPLIRDFGMVDIG